MVTLVIKCWRADDKPFDEQGTRILIEGRAGGLISWLLHLVQIEPITRLKVSAERAELERTSLSGKEHVFVPLERICHCYYSYDKPWRKALGILVLSWWLLTILLPLVAALMLGPRVAYGLSVFMTTSLAAVGALGIALAYYLLTKSFRLAFVTVGGVAYTVCFKRSIIGNQKIDAEDAAYVAEMLDYLCDARRQTRV